MKEIKLVCLLLSIALIVSCSNDDDNGGFLSCKYGPFVPNNTNGVDYTPFSKDNGQCHEIPSNEPESATLKEKCNAPYFSNEGCPDGSTLQCKCSEMSKCVSQGYDNTIYFYGEHYKSVTCEEM